MAKTKKKTPARSARRAQGKLKRGGKRDARGKSKTPGKSNAPRKATPPRRPRKSARTPRKAAPRTAAPVTAAQPSAVLRAVPAGLAPVTPVGRVEALEMKLAALERLIEALRARRTHTPEDNDEINPNIDALTNAQRELEAVIAAAKTRTLDPPSGADVEALREAIARSENVIAQNKAVNELLQAATELLDTLKK